MIPYQFYQVAHLLGVLMVFASYGALVGRVWLGSTEARLRRFCGITSGIGMALVLVSGFGMQPAHGFPTWVWVKILIWAALGGLIMVINRKMLPSLLLYWLTLGLGFLAVLMVYLKPL